MCWYYTNQNQYIACQTRILIYFIINEIYKLSYSHIRLCNYQILYIINDAKNIIFCNKIYKICKILK